MVYKASKFTVELLKKLYAVLNLEDGLAIKLNEGHFVNLCFKIGETVIIIIFPKRTYFLQSLQALFKVLKQLRSNLVKIKRL